jgi:hypothetical protein
MKKNDRECLSTRAGLHKNSVNALAGLYRDRTEIDRILRPIQLMLAQIGYILCDILEEVDSGEEE